MFYPVTFFPDGTTVLVPKKATLKQAAAEAACFLDSPCGGHGTCGKCRVRFRATGNGNWSEGLACQTLVQGPMEVELPVRAAASLCGQDARKEALGADSSSSRFGLAVDLGTTSVAARLLPLSSAGSGLEGSRTLSVLNRQTRFGADVISRIGAAREDGSIRLLLQRDAAETINQLVWELCTTCGVEPERIQEITVAGNTAMQQLFLGLDCSALCEDPFPPLFTVSPPVVSAHSLGLKIAYDATVHVFPQISGFVGGDTVAAIFATRLTSFGKPALLVDIGTNGEMALWADKRLTVASTAAGPAFEGAKISQGMRAEPGAIDHVWPEGNTIHVHTIGGLPPRGVCGSGLLDAVAELLRLQVIEATGAFRYEQDGVSLAKDVTLLQRDIREFQLAVSAIRAGIETLLAHAKIDASSLETVFLAGAFGSFLSIPNAQRVGLLPSAVHLPACRIHPVGNASLEGAVRCLRSRENRAEARSLAMEAVPLDLASNPLFTQYFTDFMLFPEEKDFRFV